MASKGKRKAKIRIEFEGKPAIDFTTEDLTPEQVKALNEVFRSDAVALLGLLPDPDEVMLTKMKKSTEP